MSFDSNNAAKQLTDDERELALNNFLENNGGDDAASGIVRQLLGEEGKPLSEKQEHIYKNEIEPCLAEKCDMGGCQRIVPAGTLYCFYCENKFSVRR